MPNQLIDAVPRSFDIDRDGARMSIIIPFEIGDDGVVRLALDVRLWGGHWRGVAMHEFKFAILVLDPMTGQVAEIFDRADAASHVEPVRRLVLPCVCAAAEALIDAAAPTLIYRATYLADPPQNSLPKHQMITDKITELGYRVLDEGLDSSHRRYWLMMKAEMRDAQS